MEYLKFYIDGEWVDPAEPKSMEVINPATEEAMGRISVGSAADVDKAVAAAKRAFPAFSQTSREDRIEIFEAILAGLEKRHDDIASAISQEMGAPMWFAKADQASSGPQHFATTLEVLKTFKFEDMIGKTRLRHEPIGVCALITPWNWPINQVAVKVAPALAAGCTMILKPSEIAPFDACILAEIIDEIGLPAGVFNLVNGDGPQVGAPLTAHPDVDMVSFTGSTQAGRAITKASADTIKRVSLELGGKSANIIFDDADLQKAVSGGVKNCFGNSGQSCNAPTRMLVPKAQYAEAVEIARETAEKVKVGDPNDDSSRLGPVASEAQYNKIQDLIEQGMKEGADLVTGGPGRPEGLNKGFYVRPTIFAGVNNDMTIAREEIFGPVLCMLPYEGEEEAIEIANDTRYGLSNYLSTGNEDRANRVAAQLRSGMVHINGAGLDSHAPFGGYKESGNGREWGAYGLEEFLEVKSVYGR